MNVKCTNLGIGLTAALTLGLTSLSRADLIYQQQKNAISGSASAYDGTTLLYGDHHSDANTTLANYNGFTGASINNDPFFASPAAQATTALGANSLSILGHTDANVNTNDVSGYANPALYADAEAATTLKFSVSTDTSYMLNASMSYLDQGGGGSFQLLDNGVQVFYTDAFSTPISQSYLFKSGHTYEIDVNAYAAVAATTSYAFFAGSTDYNVSLSSVPEPIPFAAFGFATLLMVRRKRRA